MGLTFATALRLKKAGWPQHAGQETRPANSHDGSNGWVAVPQLADLIHGCLQYRAATEGRFHPFLLAEQKDGTWLSGFNGLDLSLGIGHGPTPDESAAELWMALKEESKHDNATPEAKG